MSQPKPFGWLTVVEGKPKIIWGKLIKHLPEDSPIPVYIHPPLYTAPPNRKWVELTDDQIAEAVGDPLDMVYLQDFRKVLAKCKEVNT